MFSSKRSALGIWLGCTVVPVLVGTGCNVDGRYSGRHVPSYRLASGSESVDIRLADQREVDLVESVAAARNEYRRSLESLYAYYDGRGFEAKRAWAALELGGLRSVKQFGYLLDAEVPAGRLTSRDSISEADALYAEGVALMRRGGHGVPGIFRKDRMVEAASVFRRLIRDYPTSDKIDDAAFLCGEIHKDYLDDQAAIAVKWYERAWTWDPNTPHPAKFRAAHTYDFRLQARDQALELYHAVANNPASDPGDARFAVRRIKELTEGQASTALLIP